MSDEAELVKVQLTGPDGDLETLWAKPLGNDGARQLVLDHRRSPGDTPLARADGHLAAAA